MLNTPTKTKHALDRNTLASINVTSQNILSAQNISILNTNTPLSAQANRAMSPPSPASQASRPQAGMNRATPQAGTNRARTPQAAPSQAASQKHMPIPKLQKPLQKGQKTTLASGETLSCLNACFGWNTLNPQCDVDVSAFLLGANDKVPGDSWFVFYGQPTSPDQSVTFYEKTPKDRERIKIDFTKLNNKIQKIVFVLTINEAFEKKLNFGIMKDTYIRILNADNTELASFPMADYYNNVISMVIGEIYLYKGMWKFNAIGNGIAKDLAGLCETYGVQVN